MRCRAAAWSRHSSTVLPWPSTSSGWLPTLPSRASLAPSVLTPLFPDLRDGGRDVVHRIGRADDHASGRLALIERHLELLALGIRYAVLRVGDPPPARIER